MARAPSASPPPSRWEPGLLLGLLPFARSLVDFGLLREGGRGLTASGRQHLLRGAMVVGQVALAMVLLVAAGLMLRSFQQLRNVEPGLEPANVMTAEVALPGAEYQSYEDVTRFYRELIGRVETLPGVVSAGATQALPLTADADGCAVLFVEDRPLQPGQEPPCLGTAAVAPGFFQALGMPVRGSAPGWSEIENAAAGVVVTQALADRFWPDEDPIGKGIRPNGQTATILPRGGRDERAAWRGARSAALGSGVLSDRARWKEYRSGARPAR